ncbi:helix-turn-helix protein [compost metagenome]
MRLARIEAGLTQAELAERLGIAQALVSRIETGERRIDVPELMAIAEALGKPAWTFLDPYNSPPTGNAR